MGETISKSSGRIGANGHPLTIEQENILALPPTETRKWQAFAGCAKTTTSVEYAHAWPQYPALYLAFSAPIAADAKGKFPRHIETKTAHAFARSAMGVNRFKDRLVTRMRPDSLDGCAHMLRPVAGMTDLAVRRAILKSLNNFLISADDEVQPRHLQGFPVQARSHCFPMVADVIERLMDYENTDLPFGHDIYLKDFARRGSIPDRYKYLIIDEAQDLNPVLIDIVQKANRPAMIVGDPFQAIYAFRGAENAMDAFDGEALPLTQSFRFGPKIAAVANHILRQSLDRPEHSVIGSEFKKSSVHEYQGKFNKRCTLLARTNFRLFEGLVGSNVLFHVIGGIKEILEQVAAGYALYSGNRPATTDPVTSRFKNWAEVVDASEQEDEPDLVRLVKIVEQYTHAIPEILEGLKERHRTNANDAVIVVGTAHKAKGLEYDNVVVLDDFLAPSQLISMLNRKKITSVEYNQEINLLYVTLTRARLTLSISQPLYDEVAGSVIHSDQLFDVM